MSESALDRDPAPPPGLVDRMNRIADVEYAVADTARKRLTRERAGLRQRLTVIDRKARALWDEYRQIAALVDEINARLADLDDV